MYSLTRPGTAHLLLVRKSPSPTADSEREEVIGHAAIVLKKRAPWCPPCPVCHEQVFVIESVIVREDYRGKGLGKRLMMEVEQWILANHHKMKHRAVINDDPATLTLILYPKDESVEMFYSKLGYKREDSQYAGEGRQYQGLVVSSTPSSHLSSVSSSFTRLPPPPPPNPPPLSSTSVSSANKVVMKKHLTLRWCVNRLNNLLNRAIQNECFVKVFVLEKEWGWHIQKEYS